MDNGAVPKPIRVLFPKRRPTTNPYLVMLGEALQERDGIELVDLTWSNALAGDWDVIHLHWPEIMITGRTAARRRAKEAAFAALLASMKVRRRALVRTFHNVDLPSGITATQQRLLQRAERQTALWIVLNDHSQPPSPAPTALIPHGHYRDWFARYPASQPVPGRIGYFGLIRRYKAVDKLLRAFHEAADQRPSLSLSVAGRPSTSELREELTELAAGDPRIELRFEFIGEAEVAAHVTASQLIALTHREMFNSGTALAALSLNRPVLLPRNELNADLAAEVGTDWVLLYDEPLTGRALLEAVGRAAELPPDASPDLSRREWDDAGSAHEVAYRRALQQVRGG